MSADRWVRSRAKHAELKASFVPGPLRAMACHLSDVGGERPCAGWLANQIRDGNNIGARLAVMTGHFPVPKVEGEQHVRFEDTLPRAKPRRRRGEKAR